MDVDRQRLRAFITQVDSTGGPDACWPWRGSLADGYGRIGKTGTQAHRLAYELMRQPIPDGLVIDHTCHNDTNCPGGEACEHRRCVNPDHLQPVTQGVNLLRSRNTRANVNAAKTHCAQGHKYTPENTRRSIGATGPRRDCRTCTRERSAARRRKTAA
jgi:hypothetical protein